MSCGEWVYGPFGLDGVKGQTVRCLMIVVRRR